MIDGPAAALSAELIGRGRDVLARRLRVDEPLGELTTYRVGGPAAAFLVVESDDEVAALRRAATAIGLPVVVVGKGSNLLVADAGVQAVVVQLGEGLAGVEIGPPFDDGGAHRVEVVAGGAAPLPVVARRTAAAGLHGFEWAVGVPGTVGGAVRMNAGGHGSDMAAVVRWVHVVDATSGETRTMRPAEGLAFGYRHSALRPGDVVTSVALGLSPGDRSAAEAEIAEIVRWRRDHQPGGQNAGSVFRNPSGRSAGALIEEAGCKGLRVGSAEVSTKHANFIQADAGGSADDVLDLMAEVRRRVAAASGIDLVAETHVLGVDAARCRAAGVVAFEVAPR